MKKVILFDLDGTVIDSTDAIVNTFLYSFEKKGFDFKGSVQDIKNLIGHTLEDMYIGLGVNKDEVDAFVHTYKERYKTISVDQTFLLPQAKEAVVKAHNFARLGVVTTKTTAYTIPILENMEIYKYFETLIGRQEVINPKPHPEPIWKAIESMNVDEQNFEIYMIGDTKLDLIAAQKAGVIPIGVLTGYDSKEVLAQYSEFVFDNVYNAVEFIHTR
jgi:phosphoglycolate phosphatase